MKSEAASRPPFRATSAVSRIADELRSMALDMPEGDYIGSEETLSNMFGVSIPTLRQVARMLEHEEVLKVKRGTYGGYYAHRPTIETLTRIAAIYLRGNPSSLEDVRVFGDALVPITIDLAMQSDRLPEMGEFVDGPETSTLEEMIVAESRFAILLRDLTGNSALQFVLSTFFQLGSTIPIRYELDVEDNVRRLSEIRKRLAKALLAKDRDEAVAACRASRHLIYEERKQSLELSKPSAGRE